MTDECTHCYRPLSEHRAYHSEFCSDLSCEGCLYDCPEIDQATAQQTFDTMLTELTTRIAQYQDGKQEQPLSDLLTKLSAARHYGNNYAMLLFEKVTTP